MSYYKLGKKIWNKIKLEGSHDMVVLKTDQEGNKRDIASASAVVNKVRDAVSRHKSSDGLWNQRQKVDGEVPKLRTELIEFDAVSAEGYPAYLYRLSLHKPVGINDLADIDMEL